MKPDLRTSYLGLTLKSPILVSANPLTEKLDNLLRMEDAGAGAITLFSLFEEQIRQEEEVLDYLMEIGSESFAEALSYFPEVNSYRLPVEPYLELIEAASSRLDVPIIGSLNGITPEGWVEYGSMMESAGASALELNIFYLPVNFKEDGAAVEQRYIDVLKAVKKAVKIPVSVKLTPYFSSFADMASKLTAAGANGLILFNRFYQPDIDIEHLDVKTSVELSHPGEVRLPLLWLATLYGNLPVSLAATTGVHSGKEVIKYLLAGADVAMTASALLKNGIEYLETMHAELERWMVVRDFESVNEFRGLMSRKRIARPEAYERVQYIKMLGQYR